MRSYGGWNELRGGLMSEILVTLTGGLPVQVSVFSLHVARCFSVQFFFPLLCL